MENAVIYARYSSHNQTENSIEAQVEAAKDFALKHDLNIIHTYADRAKTGTNDNREEFQQMLKDSNSKNFQVVIVWKVDRFGRNREEITINKYHLKKNGVRLEYVAENITKEPEGVILESVLEGFAEYYSRQLSTNVRRGIHNIAAKGGYTGGTPPYGYKIIDGKYNIDEDEAKKIKEVFKLFASGLTFTDIANKLDLKYYNIRIYLSNSSYYDGVYRRCGVEIPNIIPPIITEEEFKNVQCRLRSYTRRKKPLKYILTGKLVCKKCGKIYTGSSYDNYSYYRSTCKCFGQMMYVKKEDLEKDIIDECYNIISSDKTIDKLCNKVVEKYNSKINSFNPAKKESLIAKKKRLLKLVEDGALPYEDLRERLLELDAELSTIVEHEVPLIRKDQVKKYINSFRKNVQIESHQTTTTLLEGLINKIEIGENGQYEIKFGPSHFGTD